MAQAASTYVGEQRRRSTRLEQTSPVIIRGVDLLGQPFEERTAAQNLSFHGCRYASKHHLPKNTWVTLEVPSSESRREAECVRARVAWIQKPQTQRDLFQIGVELEKGRNVWGVTAPPEDWAGSVVLSVAPQLAAHEEQNARHTVPKQEEALEVYLQMALVHANRDVTVRAEELEFNSLESNTLLGQIRQEFLSESGKIIAEARAAAGEVVSRKASELQKEIETEQRASTNAFHKKWLEEFERGKVDARQEIALALAENVAVQLSNFQERVTGALTTEWTAKLSRVQVDLSRFEEQAQALREEMRANAEAGVALSDRQLEEKLQEIRRELESVRATRPEETATHTARPSPEAAESLRKQLAAEAETARGQWNELLESSLDSAAQRLNERLTGGSQDLLHRTEQELAKRVAEIQKESGLATEASRAALDDMKGALEREVTWARASLGEIEQTAARISEYSRQLEAASQDSVKELRQQLDLSTARHFAEMDAHAVELEAKFAEQAASMLKLMGRETVTQSGDEINAIIASGLERAKKAGDELAVREEQAEGILRIHRERLRQASEQVQREGAAQLASNLASMQENLKETCDRALTHWNGQMEATATRIAVEAASSMGKDAARQLVDVDAQLLVRAQEAIDSAQERLHKSLHMIAGKLKGELSEIEAGLIERAKEKLAATTSQALDSTKNEFTKAAEKAATTFGEVVEEASEKALQDFSAATEERAEQGRARLVAAGENVLQGVQSHAQSSFEHFQEQLAIKAEQAVQHADDALTHHLEGMLERFRAQGEMALEGWSTKQSRMSDQALEQHAGELRAAARSWLDSMLEQLEMQSEERIHSAVRTTESAVRQACADVFEAVAQAMKRQLQSALEMRPVGPTGETTPQEHRASA